MKHEVEGMRRQEAEKGRAQQDSDNDFADRRRLTDPPGECAAGPAGYHNDGEFQQRIKKNEFVLMRAGGSGKAGSIQVRSFRH
jgi:hypothetical protein